MEGRVGMQRQPIGSKHDLAVLNTRFCGCSKHQPRPNAVASKRLITCRSLSSTTPQPGTAFQRGFATLTQHQSPKVKNLAPNNSSAEASDSTYATNSNKALVFTDFSAVEHATTPTIEVMAPPASLSRVLLSVQQPARATARASTGTGARSGGFGLPAPSPGFWVVAASILAAVIASTRAKMKAVRNCDSCRGYGVQRCKLCSGKGGIEWEGKMAHREPCPLCLGRRFVRCSCCGGGPWARQVFAHRGKNIDALLQQLQQIGGSRNKPRRWGFGNVEAQADNIEQSDELAEQIMMD